MKKNLMGTIDLKPSLKCEESVIIEYYIFKNDEGDDGYNPKKPYGIEVVKKQKIDGVVYREIKTVPRMTSNKKKAEMLLNILCSNNVTPISVGDILDDMAFDIKVI